VGIPKEKLDKIFEPFTRDVDGSKAIEGIGLGLTITRRLVDLMGGKLSVESDIGNGSTFTFELELDVINEVQAKAMKKEREAISYPCRKLFDTAQGKRRRVLIVDDNLTNLSLLVSILEPLGFEINTAENGQQAIDRALKEPPDLLLLDLLMPVMDGDEGNQNCRRFSGSRRQTAFESVCCPL
jgi:PleD family two-component response regulator